MIDLLLSVVGTPEYIPIEYPESGPGPKTLQYGDEAIGYFGTLSQAELYTAPELRTAVALNAGTPNTWTGNWIKMFSRGKVIYFPDAGLNNDIGWAPLYACGITSGRNSTDQPNGLTPVVQRKVIQKGEDQFVVRLFHTAPSYIASLPSTLNMALSDARLYYSEWGEIICRLKIPDTVGWTGPRWRLFAGNALMAETTVTTAANRWYWSTPDSITGYLTNYQHIVNNGYVNVIRDNRVIYGWYPVLELITP